MLINNILKSIFIMNDGYEKLCKDKYLQKEDTLLFESIKIDHDGYDKDGPESNLYDYYIIILRNNEILYEIFHREDWFTSNQEEYECFTDKPFKNKINEDISKEEDNYVENLIKFFKKKRSNVFEFIKDLKKK